MANIIIPLIVLTIIFYGVIKNVSIYDEFLEGVKERLIISFQYFSNYVCYDNMYKCNFKK